MEMAQHIYFISFTFILEQTDLTMTAVGEAVAYHH